jgi:Zn finger protein HypA/HybF involved in hydrogenase expression
MKKCKVNFYCNNCCREWYEKDEMDLKDIAYWVLDPNESFIVKCPYCTSKNIELYSYNNNNKKTLQINIGGYFNEPEEN